MNGPRPKEILELLEVLEDLKPRPGGRPAVLATVVSVDGSAYGRAGTMALLAAEGGDPAWVIGPEDLNPELRRRAEEAAEGRPVLACLELPEDDPILGFGLAAPGRAELLLEPVDRALRARLDEVRRAILQGRPFVVAVELVGPEAGRRVLYPGDHPSARECLAGDTPELVESSGSGGLRRTLLCPVRPMGKVLVFGSGRDAARLSRDLVELGFWVCVADPRPGRLRGPAWEGSGALLIQGGWEQARAAAQPGEDTAIVVMTHSFALDLETLQGALQSPAPYVGQVGPRKRAQRLLSDLAKLEVAPRPGAFFAPAGLDVGAETAEETAVSVAAEILAARSGRRGGRLAPRRPPPSAAAAAPATIPGLILAAGRGRRFSGGNKLAAFIDGRPVLRHAVENALASRLDPVIVVLGCSAEQGLSALSGLQDPRLRVVFNPLWEGGKASSIAAGLREVPATAPGVVSLLGDMPMVKPWLIDRVLSEFELSGKLAFPVYDAPEGQRKGYPTAFPRSLFGEIQALTGDDTAMEAVRRHWGEAVKIPLEDAATQADVDTAEDLQLLLGSPPPATRNT